MCCTSRHSVSAIVKSRYILITIMQVINKQIVRHSALLTGTTLQCFLLSSSSSPLLLLLLLLAQELIYTKEILGRNYAKVTQKI